MRVPQRLDYALRALTALAMRPAGDLVAAGDLAERLGLPKRFVEQQFSALSHAGIVECRRGAGGGCALARDAANITVADVALALKPTVLDVPRVRGSAVSEMWARAASVLESALANVTLAELANRQRAIDAAAAPMYYI